MAEEKAGEDTVSGNVGRRRWMLIFDSCVKHCFKKRRRNLVSTTLVQQLKFLKFNILGLDLLVLSSINFVTSAGKLYPTDFLFCFHLRSQNKYTNSSVGC